MAWGVAASFPLVAIASVLFAVAGTILAFFVPAATFALPLIILAMPLIAVGADIYARRQAAKLEKTGLDYPWFLNIYQSQNLSQMSPTQRQLAAWFANSDRNLLGFVGMPLLGVGALLGFIGLSIAGLFFPPSIHSTASNYSNFASCIFFCCLPVINGSRIVYLY